MNIREDIQPWIITAIHENGGQATITKVAKHIWEHHESELRSDDSVFYNWQYEMRWAAGELRRTRQLRSASSSTRGVWVLG
jgi:hypothetical protein